MHIIFKVRLVHNDDVVKPYIKTKKQKYSLSGFIMMSAGISAIIFFSTTKIENIQTFQPIFVFASVFVMLSGLMYIVFAIIAPKGMYEVTHAILINYGWEKPIKVYIYNEDQEKILKAYNKINEAIDQIQNYTKIPLPPGGVYQWKQIP
jgi:hypothetical protein